jgi:hypothetical protein
LIVIIRQKQNNINLFNALKLKNVDLIKKICNIKQLDRVLKEFDNINLKELLEKKQNDDDFLKMLSINISKLASRQSINDEKLILETCNIISSQYDINIIKLSNSAFRPLKNGQIISQQDFNKSNLKKNICLKSFDAKITGKINGWITSKILAVIKTIVLQKFINFVNGLNFLII